jgi:hypothetical protein
MGWKWYEVKSYFAAVGGSGYYGSLDFQQMPVVLDLLRNEKPISFGWNDANPDQCQLRTGPEPVGEADGILDPA